VEERSESVHDTVHGVLVEEEKVVEESELIGPPPLVGYQEPHHHNLDPVPNGYEQPLVLVDETKLDSPVLSTSGGAGKRKRDSSVETDPDKKKRFQVKKACTNCRSSHTACSEGRPCERCISRKIEETCKDIPRKKRVSKSGSNLMNSSGGVSSSATNILTDSPSPVIDSIPQPINPVSMQSLDPTPTFDPSPSPSGTPPPISHSPSGSSLADIVGAMSPMSRGVPSSADRIFGGLYDSLTHGHRLTNGGLGSLGVQDTEVSGVVPRGSELKLEADGDVVMSPKLNHLRRARVDLNSDS